MHTISITRNEIEKAVGRKLKDGDVVEAIVDKQTYRSTISMSRRGRVLGLLVSSGGKQVEHSLRIEGK